MTTDTGAPSTLRILVINPNTSTHMTEALKPVVEGLGFENVEFAFYTCPAAAPGSIPSINSPQDAIESAEACFPSILPLISKYDAFLVACYSHHPLVGKIGKQIRQTEQGRQYVTGIFEASVLMSLGIVAGEGTFGIVSTGKIWETGLTVAANQFLGFGEKQEKVVKGGRYAGCETTGLNASELHELPAAEVRKKMMEATKRLIKGDQALGAICLGCAGMVGLDDAVRQACVEELGREKGEEVRIVDGVKAGIATLVASARGRF